jgi:AraC-like DNA-binding protein
VPLRVAEVQNGVVSPDLDELRRLRRARDQMDREYARPLDVRALARTALMSPAHFSRRFREAYAETPYSYLMTRRIERAKALLTQRRQRDRRLSRGRVDEPRLLLHKVHRARG